MEEDAGFYWKHLLYILFINTEIILRRGESTCFASKVERQLNELEYGALSQNIFRRKIDLLLLSELVGEKDEPFEIELNSMEIKPVGVPTDIEIIQLNKNIRVNKSILHNIKIHMGDSGEDVQVLGMDVVGLNAIVYAVFQYKDVVASVPVINDLFFTFGRKRV